MRFPARTSSIPASCRAAAVAALCPAMAPGCGAEAGGPGAGLARLCDALDGAIRALLAARPGPLAAE